jgi:sulfur carrier protein
VCGCGERERCEAKPSNVKARINGETLELPEGSTVGALLERLGMARRGIAVAQNERVVTCAQFDSRTIADGDRIEIITAVAGG